MKFEVGQVWKSRGGDKWRILATDAPDTQPIVAMNLQSGKAFNFCGTGSFRTDVDKHVADLLTLDRPRREWTLVAVLTELGRAIWIVVGLPAPSKVGETVAVVEKLEGDE